MAKRMRIPRRVAGGVMACALVLAAGVATGIVHAGSPSANPSSSGYTIANNTPGFVKHATDTGAMDPSAQITVTAWLKLHNTQQLDALVQSQNTKGSSNYHKWLSQSQFNATYGATSQEVNSVENFLTAHNLSVVAVADDNSYVKVQGAVSNVEQAFHVQIDNYSLNGTTYYANTSDPNVHDSSGAHIDAISGLDDYGFQPTLAYPQNPDGTAVKPVNVAQSSVSNGLFFSAQCFNGTDSESFTGGSTSATYSGNRYGAPITNNQLGTLAPCGYQPSEMQTAYNMNPLYAAGLDGSGQTVVITDAFGSPTIGQDAEAFSQIYGLPDLTSANFQVLRAPGAVNNPVNNGHIGPGAGWAGEITLDVEWIHAMAPKARIVLVVGPNNGNDLDEAVNYAVVHHLGNTISNSWSAIEGFGNPARYNRDNRILEEAAAQGIDVNFSSGDYGDETTTVGFKSVDFPGSSPFATSIGGTSLALNSDNGIAFQTGWGNNLTKVANPETTFGTNGTPLNSPLSLGFQFGAGGGASLTFAKPAFQAGLPGSMRLVPDVSLLADPYTGVEIVNVDTAHPGYVNIGVIGGTSLACPMFSAMMAIASEKAGTPLGQAAPLMYGLSSAHSTSSPIFDVTPVDSATNVTGTINGSKVSANSLAAPLDGVTTYYSALYNSPFSTKWYVMTFGTDTSLTTSAGWDDVTGVGTPNGANFVNAVAG